MFHGCNGPVNVVEIDGTFFIENDEAEAKTAQALELASEVAVASKAPALMPKPALDSEPACSVGTSSARATHRNSYAAAAAKPPVRPKPSVAGFEPRPVAAPKFSAGLERPTPASQPAVVHAPLEVSMCIISIHIVHSHIHAQLHVRVHVACCMCMCTQHTCMCMCMCMCMYRLRADMPGCLHTL